MKVLEYFTELQARIVSALEALDGKSFLTDSWKRPEGGGGVTRVIGGRVLCVTALGDSVRTAQKRAYDAIAQTRFDGMQFRRDIGHLALKSRA